MVLRAEQHEAARRIGKVVLARVPDEHLGPLITMIMIIIIIS